MAKLLVVDDESDIREFAKRFFGRRGVDVVTAHDGRSALDAIISHRPDLVMLDIQMEGMDGISALEELRTSGDLTKVIMVTGNESPDIIEAANRNNIQAYIHKPLVLEELEKVVLRELNR
ncbi:MAG: response regulator [Candidatus Omnitrophica bacterium]|nr:response regulator [Candidatus Omnitrophota bacterium]